MARGKHAARSVKRANDAALSHIDRLTTELVDAKMRARQVQQAANSVGALRQRVAELEQQIADDAHVAQAYETTNRYWVDEMQRVLRSTFEMIDTLEREYEAVVAVHGGEMMTCAAFEKAIADLPAAGEIIGLNAPRHWRREMGTHAIGNAMSHYFNENIAANHALQRTQPFIIQRIQLWKKKGSSPKTVADSFLDELVQKAPSAS